MNVRFAGYTEILRMNLESCIDTMIGGLSADRQDEVIDSFFNELKEKNYDFYTNLIGLMFSDCYKILKDDEHYNNLSEEESTWLEMYSSFRDKDDIVEFVDDNPDFITVFLYYMSKFNNYGYFDKRDIWLNSKDDLKVLSRMSSLNILDYMHYCQKYTIETLKSIYDDYTSEDPSLIGSFQTIKATLLELGITDGDNYYEVASDLLTLYYIIAKDELGVTEDHKRKNKIISMIKKLEKSNYFELLSYMENDKFIDEVLMQVFANENRTLNSDLENDIIYNETVQKLKKIKTYLID